MREMLLTHKDILHKLDEIERKYTNHDQKILLIFEYLKQLGKIKDENIEHKHRKVIKGYRKKKK